MGGNLAIHDVMVFARIPDARIHVDRAGREQYGVNGEEPSGEEASHGLKRNEQMDSGRKDRSGQRKDSGSGGAVKQCRFMRRLNFG